jgi:hypothetical protein
MKRAKEGELPKLVESKDLKGVLHVLTEYLGSLAPPTTPGAVYRRSYPSARRGALSRTSSLMDCWDYPDELLATFDSARSAGWAVDLVVVGTSLREGRRNSLDRAAPRYFVTSNLRPCWSPSEGL